MQSKPLIGTELKRFLRDYRRLFSPSGSLAALLQSVEYPYNVGAIFRLADGAGLSELILTGITPTPPQPTIDKVARYKTDKVNWSFQNDPVEAIKRLKADDYHIVAVELTTTAVPYHRYTYPKRTCLVVGHEDHGVTKTTLAQCNGAVFIPMYGKGVSLNVHTALAVVVYHILQSRES